MLGDKMIKNKTIIWRLVDGKPGHESQSLGLVMSLKAKLPCQCFDISIAGKRFAIINYLKVKWLLGKGLPLPDLIIGAGHRTHLHMLAAQKSYGGKTIVLMKPSLPASLFDLCLIPEHDNFQGIGNVLKTKGVLNPIKTVGPHHKNRALIMIGGPSKHFGWDADQLIGGIKAISKANSDVQYTVTTSRRTPIDFIALLRNLKSENVKIIPFSSTSKDWIAKQLSNSSSAWVSEDSVSMIYEALTARVAVCLLPMPIKKKNRISQSMLSLVEQGFLVRFDKNGEYQRNMKPALGFIEADRCADWVLNEWLLASPEQTGLLELKFQQS